MSDNKKYYYLKLKDNFFDSEELKILESMPNGYLYSNILLKMYLRSLKNEGRLMLKENIPYNENMLATITGHNIDIVKSAINNFIILGLVEKLDNGTIYISDIQSFIGESSSEADRKRAYRARISEEKDRLSEKRDICPKITGHLSVRSSPEIEIELEKEINIKSKDKCHDDLNQNKHKKEEDIQDLKKEYAILCKAYPERPGDLGETEGYERYKNILKTEDTTPEKLLSAVKLYHKDCERLGNLNTKFILQISTFFGPKKKTYKNYLLKINNQENNNKIDHSIKEKFVSLFIEKGIEEKEASELLDKAIKHYGEETTKTAINKLLVGKKNNLTEDFIYLLQEFKK